MSKILVVDDQPTARDVITTLMRYAGHEVVEASDGAEALEIARRTHPDLIITDILMPTMDGYEFVRHLRREPAIAGTNVIFNTATYHDREAAVLAAKCGVSYLMHKPSEPQEILRIVQSALAIEPLRPTEPPQEFDREHLQLITDKLADKVSTLETVSSRLEVLVGLSQEAALIRDVRVLVDKFCRSTRQMMSAKYAGALLFDAAGTAVEYFALAGAEAAVRQQIQTPAIAGIFRTLAASAVPLREKDFRAGWRSRLFPNHPLVYSFLGAAVRGPDNCYGIIYVANKVGGDNFDKEEIDLIRTLSSQLAVHCENVRLYGQLNERAAELKSLSKRLIDIRENEQRHIARELHDEIGQGLTALKIHLQTAESANTEDVRLTQLGEGLRITETTLQQVRSLCLNMRPSILDDLGLVPALRWLLDRQAAVGKYTAEFIANPGRVDVPAEVRTACYRIAQESLTNIIKHANANKVSVVLHQNGNGLFLSITDDGAGYVVSEARKQAASGKSVGVLGMEERANLTGGRLSIESAPGKGTTVSVHFPEYRRSDP